MILTKFKPISPGSRHKITIKSINPQNITHRWQKINKKKCYGRSTRNGILVYSRTAPIFRKSINFLEKRFLTKRLGVFTRFIHYFNNKSYYGLIKYSNGAFSNVVVPHAFLPGNFLKTTNNKPSRFTFFNLGDTVLLKLLNRKHVFYNVYLNFKNKIIFSKAAGTFCTILINEIDKHYVKLKLPSGDTKVIYNQTFVTLGRNSNILQKSIVYGKAGDVVNNGFKSVVRGVAMNPVDHPHGGRTKTNSPEKTPWGKIAKKNK